MLPSEKKTNCLLDLSSEKINIFTPKIKLTILNMNEVKISAIGILKFKKKLKP